MVTLIIVDCQNDFISGTMPVKGAKEALTGIKEFIGNNEIDKIIFTADWHISKHPSFKKNGGEWPSHCVQFTPGACIESKLLKYVISQEIDYDVVTKGEEEEQYGAFKEIIKSTKDFFGVKYYLDNISIESDSRVIVCGIAGDYCVKETMKNLINAGITPEVLISGIASIDDGEILNDFIKKHNLKVISNEESSTDQSDNK